MTDKFKVADNIIRRLLKNKSLSNSVQYTDLILLPNEKGFIHPHLQQFFLRYKKSNPNATVKDYINLKHGKNTYVYYLLQPFKESTLLKSDNIIDFTVRQNSLRSIDEENYNSLIKHFDDFKNELKEIKSSFKSSIEKLKRKSIINSSDLNHLKGHIGEMLSQQYQKKILAQRVKEYAGNGGKVILCKKVQARTDFTRKGKSKLGEQSYRTWTDGVIIFLHKENGIEKARILDIFEVKTSKKGFKDIFNQIEEWREVKLGNDIEQSLSFGIRFEINESGSKKWVEFIDTSHIDRSNSTVRGIYNSRTHALAAPIEPPSLEELTKLKELKNIDEAHQLVIPETNFELSFDQIEYLTYLIFTEPLESLKREKGVTKIPAHNKL